jgi:hypothetical protein
VYNNIATPVNVADSQCGSIDDDGMSLTPTVRIPSGSTFSMIIIDIIITNIINGSNNPEHNAEHPPTSSGFSSRLMWSPLGLQDYQPWLIILRRMHCLHYSTFLKNINTP